MADRIQKILDPVTVNATYSIDNGELVVDVEVAPFAAGTYDGRVLVEGDGGAAQVEIGPFSASRTSPGTATVRVPLAGVSAGATTETATVEVNGSGAGMSYGLEHKLLLTNWDGYPFGASEPEPVGLDSCNVSQTTDGVVVEWGFNRSPSQAVEKAVTVAVSGQQVHSETVTVGDTGPYSVRIPAADLPTGRDMPVEINAE